MIPVPNMAWLPLTLSLVFALLSGCTRCGGEQPKAASAAADSSTAPAKGKTLSLYIWGDYTSKPLLEEFTRRTGIQVVESNYASNEELLAKLQAGASGYDVAVPSDYMVAVMIKLGLLRELDPSKLPNKANLDPKLLGQSYDPENRYSLPYGYSLTGIAVNRAHYPEAVSSWADLLQNDRAKGRISWLDDVRETVGAALKVEGASLNTTEAGKLRQAKALLMAGKGNVKAFNSTPADLLLSGEVVLAHMYSSEALVARRESGQKIDFVVPKEGATLAIDNLVILKDAQNVEEAHAFINFLHEVDSNVELVSRLFSGPVVLGVKDKLPPEVQGSAALFPSAEVLAKSEMMQDLGAATADYDRLWSELKASTGP